MTISWKSVFLMCTNKTSTNLGCNNSFFTHLVEEHSHVVPFWRIVHQWELVIKEYVSRELLSNIKECLIKLLYNKNTKKLTTLRELIDKLIDFVDFTDNFEENDCGAYIRACGTRWIEHLVKVIQRAINKFGVHLTDLKNFVKNGKKWKNGWIFWLCQQMARLLIPTWDGTLFCTCWCNWNNFY